MRKEGEYSKAAESLYAEGGRKGPPYYSEEKFQNEYNPPKAEKEAPGAETPVSDPCTNASIPTTTLSTADVPIPGRHLEATTTQPEVDPQSMSKLPVKSLMAPSPTANVSMQEEPVKAAALPGHAVLWSNSPNLETAHGFPVGRETFRHYVPGHREQKVYFQCTTDNPSNQRENVVYDEVIPLAPEDHFPSY
ncbi:PREDICTED: enamelin-like, partial [Fulmarus glacialis]|uniref:enamelin-like n=1 Tax=Fulmarus glacialis TaxID=30455 RepID=UPI00051C773E